MRTVSIICGTLGLLLAVFAWWGMFTISGGHSFDEMAGMIPLAAAIAAPVFWLIAVGTWLLAVRGERIRPR